MPVSKLEIAWRLEGDFPSGRYVRRHLIRLDGGMVLSGSASPDIVPLPLSDAEAADPEELFLAALAACHMLWALDLARRRGWRLQAYDDAPEGRLELDAAGFGQIAGMTLRPRLTFAGEPAPEAALAELHAAAHHACFLARSVAFPIAVEPRPSLRA